MKRPSGAVIPPVQTSRPRGRPPGARNKNTSDIAKKFDYTRSKQNFQKPADFLAYLAGYPNKSGLCAYLYRMTPRIDVTMIGLTEVWIHKTSNEAEMTEEWIAANYGRGTYMLALNDANRERGQTECCKTFFDCSLAEKPPQYDPRTLCLGESKNQDEINRLLNIGVLVRDPSGATRLRNAGDTAPAPVVVQQGGSPYGQAMEGFVAKAMERMFNSPHDMAKDMLEAAKLFRTEQPALSVDDIVDKVAARIGGAKNGSDFEAYERVEGFITKVRGAAGMAEVVTGKGGVFSNPAAFVPHIAPAVREVRLLLVDVFGFLRRPGPPAAPQQQQGQVETMDTQDAAAVGPRPKSREEAIALVAELAMEKLAEGMEGWDFASWLCAFYHPPIGLDVYKYLEAAGGTTAVMGLLAFDARSRHLLSDAEQRGQIEAFLDSFFTFDASADPVPAGSSAEPSA